MHPEIEKLVAAGRLTSEVAEALSLLEPGNYCLHRSWGPGRVADWDLLGDRILIDFEGKPGHAMKLEFAVKALDVVPETHVMARRFSNPDELKQLAADDPRELMRNVLESYGCEMSLDAVEVVLKGSIIEDDKYKSWWDGAKRKMRQDRAFVVPSKRNEPLLLRASDLSPANALLQDFAEARDLKDKSKALANIIKDLTVFDDVQGQLEPLVKEVNEAAGRSLRMHPVPVIELVAARDELRKEVPELKAIEGELTIAEIVQREEGRIGELLSGFPVSRQRLVLNAFEEAFGDEWTAKAIGMLKVAGPKAIAEIARHLVERGKIEELQAYLSRGVQDRMLGSDMLAWVCKERKGAAEPVFTDEISSALMHALERDHYDETARRSNRLLAIVVDDKELIPDLVRGMESSGVKALGRRLMVSPVVDDLSRRSLMARIIKTRPEAQELVSDEHEKEEEALIVSWESLKRRQEEFDDIVKRQIPENSQEIKIAREHGDLRENFEFKAAKQQQAVLMRRKTEMQRDLGRAKGTDFADADPSKVSIGAVVLLEDVSGSGEDVTYTILGAWDTDPQKNIVSYVSELGKALIGCAVGDRADLPAAEEGEPPQRVRVAKIEKFAG